MDDGSGFPAARRLVLCEDEELLLEFLHHVLAERGYHVQAFASAEECLQGVEGPVHLLLTDLCLPGLDGRQLHRRLSERFERMEVLFMSGYVEEGGPGGDLHRSGRLLPKPFSSDQLLRTIEGVLAGLRWLKE